MGESGFTRASRQQPCPVCKKPDWCLVAKDAAICMRVQSPREHVFTNHAVGWIHRFDEPLPKFRPAPKREVPELKVKDLLCNWNADATGPRMSTLAIELGVTYNALYNLGCVWSPMHRAWAFPMRGGDGEYKGIRLRNSEGRKWAVTGSKEGVFYAFGNPNTDTLFVVEGPTDTAAAMSIGLDCVGRPSCHGGVDEIRVIVRNQKFKRVVIVADRDEAGRRGAKALADAMFVSRCILNLPAKDMRDFVKNGGQRTVLDYQLSSVIWSTKR